MSTTTPVYRSQDVRRVEPHEVQKDANTAAPLTHEQRLERMRKLTQLMDEAFALPGTNFRVGWDSIIGMVPVLGDMVTAGISMWMIREAKQMGVSKWHLTRMVGNVGADMLVGLVPGVGDVADAAFKSNTKNMKILEKHVAKQQGKTPK